MTRVVGEREERLREALLIALANNPLCDDLPDDLADATHLYDVGLLQLRRDSSDEYYTSITDAGQEFILAALASSPSPPDREQAVERVAEWIFEWSMEERAVFTKQDYYKRPWAEVDEHTKHGWREKARHVIALALDRKDDG